jgi:histidinol-phosphatase
MSIIDNADLRLALDLADAADAVTMSTYLSGSLRVETKPDRTPVTEADQSVERLVRGALADQRPDDTVLGEEYGASGGVAGRTWIIDPVDGTANYLRGVPVWATLIGLVVDGEPTVGVVSAPAMGRRWWAAPDGTCATRDVDGSVRPLTASGVTALSDASLSYSDAIGWPAGALDRLTASVWRSRAYGDFWSHMLVAEGAIDVSVEPALAPWDVAALIPIVRAAGGEVCSTRGGNVLAAVDGNWTVPAGLLCTNGRLTEATLGLLTPDA